MQTKQLPRSTPVEQGVSPESIMSFLDAIKQDGLELHSLMILRNGSVIAEGWWQPYRADDPHQMNSLSKSFTSTAIGLAVHEGLLSLEDTVISFFPEYVTEQIAENMKELRVKHLLSMSTGHDQDTTPTLWRATERWVETFLNIPIVYEPGTHFLYNTGASYVLSAILHKVTGIQLLDYLRPRLFEPLGIEGITTATCPDGIHAGGYGMQIKTEDIAKFGQLYLQQGIWNGRRILPEAWVKAATSKQVTNDHTGEGDWAQGYGYQFWRCRHDAYRGDGAFGQYCVVLPDHQAVIVITAGLKNMQIVMDHVWQYLLPGMTESVGSSDLAAQERLRLRLESLTYLPDSVPGQNPSDWSTPEGAIYNLSANAANLSHITFTASEQGVLIEFRNKQAVNTLDVGFGRFEEGTTTLNGFQFRYAASGVWRTPNVLEISLYMTEYAISDRMTCHFIEDRVQISSVRNVGIVPVLSDMGAFPELVGSRYP